MRDKVLVGVFLAATQRTYEFRIPFDLQVGEVANLIARMLASRERCRFAAPAAADLMYVDGDAAGTLLDSARTVRELVLTGRLVDGQLVALT